MNEHVRTYFDEQAHELDDSVRQALEMTNGDAVGALRAVLIANTFLHEENERLRAKISMGFYSRPRQKSPSVPMTVAHVGRNAWRRLFPRLARSRALRLGAARRDETGAGVRLWG